MYLPWLKRTHVAFSLSVLLAVVAIALLGSRASAVERKDIQTVGVPFVGSVGVQRTNADIIAEERRHQGEPLQADPIWRNEFEFERGHNLRQNPASPLVASVPPMPVDKLIYTPPGSKNRPDQLSPQGIGPNFLAATLAGVNPTNAFPPDCDGAIGPTQYVVAVNGRIVSFNKFTGLQDGMMGYSTDNFFNSVRNGIGTSDPMCRYDRLSGRWFITIINVSTPNRYLIGVSDAASNGVITLGTVWTYFFFVPATIPPSIGNCLTDYPSLGIDANALYMGGDEFCPSSFQQTDGFVIRKSSLLSGGPLVVTAFRNLMSAGTGFVGPWAPRGVDNYDPASNEGYFIGVDGNSYGNLQLRRVSDPGGTPAISGNVTIAVPATDAPLNSNHLGNTTPPPGTGNIDALDDRLFHAHIRNQQLWTSHNIGVNNTGVSAGTLTRDGTRWYQIDVPVGAGAPTVVQSGTVFTATGTNLTTERNYIMPSIVVSGQGHAALGFTTAGTAERINCATVGRLVDDPLGTMQTPVLLTASATAYNPPGDNGATRGRRRWGDYSITSVDPIDDMSMWTVQMYCDATNSYGVRVARLIAPPPATPNAMPDVVAGYPSVNVTLTGLAVSGSGFFDPGADLPGVPAYNHLSAVISNGAATGTPPTVVSATYVNPTSVNLVLNTSAATPNLPLEKYTITITNPDGQQMAGAVVHVVAATQYTITASAGTGGSISPSGSVVVNSGSDQEFAITPDNACYVIADVVVDGSSVGAVSGYTFTNVTADHTIDASFSALGPYTITTDAGPNGSISPTGPVVVNCGDSQGFSISAATCYSIANVLVDGNSVGAVASYTFFSVSADHTIAASFVLNQPGAVTGLTATQRKFGNDGSGNTKIELNWPIPPAYPGMPGYEVWRKDFGGYPLYSPGGVPPLPASYPPAGWTLTGVTTAGQTDQPGRGYWYYVVYAKDACAASDVTSMTTGTLGYHLGDVSDGVTPGTGDNTVNTADASLLGAHYGASGVALAGYEYLDVGPTTDFTTDGRPTVDGSADFEDLVMFALNYTPAVSQTIRPPTVVPSARISNSVTLKAPYIVNAGQAVDAVVKLAGGGDIQALSVTLAWDPAVVRPMDVTAGQLVMNLGGVVLSPGPGRADAAILGAGRTMAGEGDVASVRFRAIATGDPKFTFDRVVGRDAANKSVSINAQDPFTTQAAVSATELLPVIPNPSQGASLLQYSLASRGVVDLSIYSVDGRLVKTVTRGVQEVGRYHVTWNGTDEHGTIAKSGLYFIRLSVGGLHQSRLITVIR